MCACSSSTFRTPFIQENIQANPTPNNLHICESARCRTTKTISLHDEEWVKIRTLFKAKIVTSQQERNVIAQSIAQLETIAGKHSEIWRDKKKNHGQIVSTEVIGQLDCNAETVNTNNFLRLLERANLFRFHNTVSPRYRGFTRFKAPHFTATIKDQKSNELFAIDSWFHNNGEKPEVVDIQSWLGGYAP